MCLFYSRKWLGLFIGAFVGLSFLLTKSFISGISASPVRAPIILRSKALMARSVQSCRKGGRRLMLLSTASVMDFETSIKMLNATSRPSISIVLSARYAMIERVFWKQCQVAVVLVWTHPTNPASAVSLIVLITEAIFDREFFEQQRTVAWRDGTTVQIGKRTSVGLADVLVFALKMID